MTIVMSVNAADGENGGGGPEGAGVSDGGRKGEESNKK